jgi:hypothetical protein
MPDTPIRTIDELGPEASARFAIRSKELQETKPILQQASIIGSKAEVSVISPSTTSLKKLFPEDHTTWALFASSPKQPPNLFSSPEISPNLSSEMLESRVEILSNLPNPTEDVLKEQETLSKLITHLTTTNKSCNILYRGLHEFNKG